MQAGGGEEHQRRSKETQMIARSSRYAEVLAAMLAALLIAGLLYVGMILLSGNVKQGDYEAIEGAIFLSKPKPQKEIQEPEHKKLKEPKPPEKILKQFTASRKNAPNKPVMDLKTPSFAAELHPGLAKGQGLAMPLGDLGGIGFQIDEVDEVPKVIRSITPQYPLGAKRTHVEGEVVIKMLVEISGKPSHLSIYKSSPKGVFEEAALAAARKWKFKPGRYAGQDVDTWVLLPFKFELN